VGALLSAPDYFVVEPGTFTIMVGGNSIDLTTTKLTVVER